MPAPTVIGHPQGERGQQRRQLQRRHGRVQPSHGRGQHRRERRARGEGNPWQLTLPPVENIEAPDLQPAPSASFLSPESERKGPADKANQGDQLGHVSPETAESVAACSVNGARRPLCCRRMKSRDRSGKSRVQGQHGGSIC
jgi:hypothetical protein